jgi:type II secretory ATPase GspE/PulE/Tfp pilus assembly ATPase PilB-like protein
MARILMVLAVAAAAVLLPAAELWAQQTWPQVELARDWRGPGFYLSLVKLFSAWLLFLLWTATTDWVSRDVQEVRKLSYLRWNPIVFGSFVGAFVLLWLIPWFWLGFLVLVAAYAGPLTAYVLIRNRSVAIAERVMTPAHIRHWVATRLNKVGVKMAAEAADPHETGPPVKLFARGAPTDRDNAVRLGLARQAPGLREVRKIIAAALQARATAILLDYTQQGVAVRYMIDGVWLDREATQRETADPALEALKILCGLNAQDRQKRQEGPFAAEFANAKLSGTLAAQGTPTGERAVIQFEEKQAKFETLEQLGMRPKMQEQLKQLLEGPKGFVLFSAIPAGGLRTTMNLAIRGMDRLMRDFAGLEEETNRYEPIDNIAIQTYKTAAGESPAGLLVKLFRTEPNVVVVRDLVNGETVKLLCQWILEEGRMALGSIRAKDSAEALLRVLALGAPAVELAKATTVVLNQRLVRKLCEKCKEAYPPPPEVLQQLGIPAGRVQSLYRPRQPNPEVKQKPCEECGEVGYRGRVAIYEMLVVGDNVRKTLAAGPKLDLLRAAARKDGMRTLQEEGVLLVARGVTSLPELMRVMKS